MVLVITLPLFGCGTSVSADPEIPKFTTNTGSWIDTTGTIDLDLLSKLKTESDSLSQDGFQTAGVFFSNCVTNETEFANKVGDVNGIGDANKDNGLLIAVYLDKTNSNGEKPVVAVAVGKGLEALLNDAKVGRFLDNYFVPLRKDGKWEEGLYNTVQAIHSYLLTPEAEEFKTINSDNNIPWWGWVLIILLMLLIAIALVAASEGGGSSWSSGGGFSSGGSFGSGGGFGGGGASR
jgi:uncharacterized protein